MGRAGCMHAWMEHSRAGGSGGTGAQRGVGGGGRGSDVPDQLRRGPVWVRVGAAPWSSNWLRAGWYLVPWRCQISQARLSQELPSSCRRPPPSTPGLHTRCARDSRPSSYKTHIGCVPG